MAFAAPSGQPLRIQSVVYQPATHSLEVFAQDGARYSADSPTFKLTHPHRLIIDIPDAYLSTATRTIPIREHGIEQVELSQTLGTMYQVVRLTVFASNPEAIQRVSLKPKDNMLQIAFSESDAANQQAMTPPLPRNASFSFLDQPFPSNLNVIQSVSFENGTLKLKADPGKVLVVKNQFTLTGPNRLVIDIANAALADKRMTQPMDFRSGPFRCIRLGQFDESTVRIVIEAPRPNGLFLVYPEKDKSHIAISPSLSPTIGTLPLENQQMGVLQDIALDRRQDSSVLKLATTQPMVRRIVRRGNEIEVDLFNISAKPAVVTFDKKAFPEIQEIRLSPLSAQEPNTKLIIELNQPGMDLDSHVSLDGKTMELALTPRYSTARNNGHGRMPTLILPNGIANEPMGPVPALPRGTFTVVVDAGHGGKDLGANRAGVHEKDLNLSVALKLKQALEAKGIRVYMTRASDMYLQLSQITGITNRIRPDVFVSVHTNASVNPSVDGLETYYFTPQSRNLALRVHRRLINSVSSPDRGVRTARFYVIHHTSVPAILCEMGYISNPAERAELQTESRQRATAEAIAQGVVEFLGSSLRAEAP